MEKKPPIKFYGVFVHCLRAHEVVKFGMIKLYLDVSDVIDANEHPKYANCGLPVGFWIFLLMSLFYYEKRSFEAKVVTLALRTL